MTGPRSWGRKGRALALAGGFACGAGVYAQEAEVPPPWLDRVLQALERIEAEQQALRRELEALRARPGDSPGSESAMDLAALFEAEPEHPVPEDSPEIQRIAEDLAHPEAERQEAEALRARRDEPQAREGEPLAMQGEADSAPPVEWAEPDADAPAEVPGAAGEEVPERVPDSLESEERAIPEEKVFEPQVYQPAARLYEQGREAFRNLNFYHAAKVFREFLAKYPAHGDAGEARYWLGEALYVEGRFQDAVAAFAEVVDDETNPRREAARLKTGYAWFELGDLGRAEAILTQVRDQNPDSDLARLAQLRLDRLQRRAGGE